MVDIMTLQSAFLSLKTASEIAKGMLHLNNLAEVQGKVIDLQEAILSAQKSALDANAEQFAMIEHIHQLEEEMARIKAWEGEKQRYQLLEPWPGCFVYALKESSKGSEPPHWICEHCYQDGRKSIIQNGEKWDRHTIELIKCSHCAFWAEIRGETARQYAQ